MPAVKTFEIRLWNSGSVAYRALPLSINATKPKAYSVTQAKWRLTRTSGYADATLSIMGDATQIAGMVKGRRIELYGKDSSGNALRLYRGYVARIEVFAGPPVMTTVTLYGIWQRRGKMICRQRWAWPQSTDIANAFSQMANRWIGKKYPDISIASTSVGQTIDNLDGWRRPIEQVANDLIALTGGFAVSGGDVDPTSGADRLFFRPYGSAASPTHILPFPDPAKRVVTYQAESDASRITNVLELNGGTLRFPNLLAQACKNNTAFDAPVFNSGSTGDLLEAGTLYGGTSYKAGDGIAGYGYSEDLTPLALSDNVGEGQTWTFPKGGTSVTPGDSYTFWTRLRLSTGGDTGCTARLRVIWQNSAGTILRTDVQDYNASSGLNSAVWDTYVINSVCPSTATKGYCQVELTAKTSGGIVMVAPKFYDSSILVQDGWELYRTGSASVNKTDWAYESDSVIIGGQKRGAYSVYIDGISDDVDNNDLSIRPLTNPPFSVSGKEQVRFSVWVKSPPGETTIPKLQMQIFDYKSDDSYFGVTKRDIAAGSALSSWTQYDLTKVVNTDAAKCRVSLVMRGTGKILVGAMQVRDSGASASEFVRADVFEGTYRADTLFGSGAIHDSVTNWDEQPEIEEQASIMTGTDATTYATAKFNARATPLERPQIEIVGVARDFWPGQYVAAIGSDAAAILPTPLPIAEVEGSWSDNLLRLRPYLLIERESEVRVTRQIAAAESLRTGRGGSSRSASSFASGSGGGGSAGGSLTGGYINDYYDIGNTLIGPSNILVLDIGSGMKHLIDNTGGGTFPGANTAKFAVDNTGVSVTGLNATATNGRDQGVYIESVGSSPTLYLIEPTLSSGLSVSQRLSLRKAVAGNITLKGSTSTVLVEGSTSFTWSGPVGDTMILQYFIADAAPYAGTVTGWRIVGGTAANKIAGGISATVTLAKITVGGTNGSLTFSNGLLTAKVDPT